MLVEGLETDLSGPGISGPGSRAHLVERRKLGASILQEILQRTHSFDQWGVEGFG